MALPTKSSQLYLPTLPPEGFHSLPSPPPSPTCLHLADNLLQSLSILASLSPSSQRKCNHVSKPPTTRPCLLNTLQPYPNAPDKETCFPGLLRPAQSGPAPPPTSPYTMLPLALPAPVTLAFSSSPWYLPYCLLPLGVCTCSSLSLETFSLLPPQPNACPFIFIRYKVHKVH